MNDAIYNSFTAPNEPQLKPSISRLQFTFISKKYASYRRMIGLSFTFLFCLLMLILLNQPWLEMSQTFKNILNITAILEGSLGLILITYRNFADPKKCYSIREQDISYRSGLIFDKVVSQPVLRIQHVELKQGPVDRKIGLAKLQVFSAGGALHTFEIPGLPLNEAEQLRQFILSHKDLSIHG